MMINPAPDVPDSLEDTNDLSKYSYNSDKPDAIGMHSENNLDDDGEVPEEEETESFQRPNLSDRYVRTYKHALKNMNCSLMNFTFLTKKITLI